MTKRKKRYNYFTTNASKLSIISKIVIVILVLGLIINHINMTVFANAFEKSTETIISDQSITEISEYGKQEIEDEKTKYSKTYKLDNGLYETEIYNKAVHYLDNGKYVNIYNTLIEHDNYYKNNKNAYVVTFPKSLKDNEVEINYLDYSLPLRGTYKSSIPAYRLSTVATIHTHAAYDSRYGNGNDDFSNDDLKWADRLGLITYMVNPNGELLKYDPVKKTKSKLEGTFPRDPMHP